MNKRHFMSLKLLSFMLLISMALSSQILYNADDAESVQNNIIEPEISDEIPVSPNITSSGDDALFSFEIINKNDDGASALIKITSEYASYEFIISETGNKTAVGIGSQGEFELSTGVEYSFSYRISEGDTRVSYNGKIKIIDDSESDILGEGYINIYVYDVASNQTKNGDLIVIQLLISVTIWDISALQETARGFICI